MKIAISSGKGGTGKTFIATNISAILAERGEKVTYLDCDVEEPNGHLFLKPEFGKTEPVTIQAPVSVDRDKCTSCGACVRACHYNAMAMIRGKVILVESLCHACGACTLVCPTGAIKESEKEIGTLRHGKAGAIDFHDGLLHTAVGGMSPRIIRELKGLAGEGTTILDSPPGTACSTVETVKDADLVILVTDPTPFAINDLKLSVNMCREIGQEPAVVVNRTGIDDTDLKRYLEAARLEVVGEIPDDRRIAETYSVGDLVVEKLPEFRKNFEGIIEKALEAGSKKREVRKELIEPLFRPGGEPLKASGSEGSIERPHEIVIISGKGGTGKTSLSACFAQLAEDAVISDCDVDAADLHLVLTPRIEKEGDFVGGVSVEIDHEKCTGCGACARACRFEAIFRNPDGTYRVDETACEGCGACEIACPEKAIRSWDSINGKWFVSNTRFGPMSHAVLGYAQENTGRLVSVVRDLACRLAEEGNPPYKKVVIDGSPGTGCPVISSVTGAGYAVVVTEPTVSGLHDLKRVLDVTRHFGVPTGVVVNKADLNPDMAQRIEEAAREAGAEPLGTLPYDSAFTKAQVEGKTLLEHSDGAVARAVKELWAKITEAVKPALES